jgi:RNA polymerase primary sigma factor
VTPEKELTMKGGEETLLQLYLNEIGRYPLLSHQEEKRLCLRAAAGDQEARHALIRANLRFVVSVAKRYQHNGIPLADLISEGNLGLMRAAESYDATKGYHFISYAAWWVRQAILKAISEKSRLIRLPWNRANELLNIERERCELENERSGPAATAALARRLEMDQSHLHNLLNCARRPLSLDRPAGDSADTAPLGELIPDLERCGPADAAIRESLKDTIAELLRALTEKEAEILRYRFGLDGRKCLSLQELGGIFRLSKERIRQIEKRALNKLRGPSRRRLLEAFIA